MNADGKHRAQFYINRKGLIKYKLISFRAVARKYNI